MRGKECGFDAIGLGEGLANGVGISGDLDVFHGPSLGTTKPAARKAGRAMLGRFSAGGRDRRQQAALPVAFPPRRPQ